MMKTADVVSSLVTSLLGVVTGAAGLMSEQ